MVTHQSRDAVITQYAKNMRIPLEESRAIFDRHHPEDYWDNPHEVGEYTKEDRDQFMKEMTVLIAESKAARSK